MSLLHVMYNIYSEEAVYTKIICTQYDYHMKKKQYDARGFHDILQDKKKR